MFNLNLAAMPCQSYKTSNKEQWHEIVKLSEVAVNASTSVVVVDVVSSFYSRSGEDVNGEREDAEKPI